MPIESLDPRVSRLGIEYETESFEPLTPMDQLETYENFVQTREGKPYVHVGIMHAASNELAFIEGKEQYGRRGKCYGLWSVKTANVTLSPYCNIDQNIWEIIKDVPVESSIEYYDVFIQKKRGAQHKHLCTIKASSPDSAFSEAKKMQEIDSKGCNLWAIRTTDILKSSERDKVIFATAHEKQFREALIYKVKDRIDAYRIKNNMN